jgi:hypothetical protein
MFLAACVSKYDGGDFTFSAPFGFKTKEFKAYTDSNRKSEYLLFAQNGHLTFQIMRKEIPADSDLDTVFEAYLVNSRRVISNFQFISQSKIELKDRKAIEYIYREFNGEPYVQTQEIWIENNGRAYALICTEPVDATPGAIIPVSDQCQHLLESFQFK